MVSCSSALASLIALAMPQWATKAWRPLSRMLADLMSRWINPASCASESASPTSRRICAAASSGSSPSDRSAGYTAC